MANGKRGPPFWEVFYWSGQLRRLKLSGERFEKQLAAHPNQTAKAPREAQHPNRCRAFFVAMETNMPNEKDYQLDFRPATYWEGPEEGFVNIKGEMRRRILDAAFEKGEFNSLPASVFSDELSDEERTLTSAIHPHFMGGEYLPGYLPGEVEIARVSLNSVTWDVISIRACRVEPGRIAYRIADEYKNLFKCQPEVSKSPLTMKALISLIDSAEDHTDGGMRARGLTTRYRNLNYDCILTQECLLEMLHFVRVTSMFYPELEAWYEDEAKEWYLERLDDFEQTG